MPNAVLLGQVLQSARMHSHYYDETDASNQRSNLNVSDVTAGTTTTATAAASFGTGQHIPGIGESTSRRVDEK